MSMENSTITLEIIIKAPINTVWNCFTIPDHITKWNHASTDWHSPYAHNDLSIGGKFLYRMEEKNGEVGFDFSGTYVDIKLHEQISYILDDERKVDIFFHNQGNETKVIQTFEMENVYPREMQEEGWYSILHNFKDYVESIE